ncbi:MAG: hypothetical protein E4G99_12695 [Anaerolineales bacterium]|nr:MAG: hypothetical protein E4G99_12695 [Anaerolineales bacterium]
MSLEDALAVTPEDRRDTVLEEMGAPDAFTISFEELEGIPVRWETWSYFDFNSRFDFMDGELLWTIELEPVSDGSIYAHFYDPRDFQASLSVAEVRTLLSDQQLVEIDLSEGDIPGGYILAGDQILLGFDQDRLVYVETFILSPAEGDEGVGYLPTLEPETPLTVTDTPAPVPTPNIIPLGPPTHTAVPGQPLPQPVGALAFADDFESSVNLAVPLFGTEYMNYSQLDGKGRLESNFASGVMVAMYAAPMMQDFIAEFEISSASTSPGTAAGLVFRSEAASGGLDFYYHILLDPEQGSVELDAWKGGQWTTRTSKPIPAILRPDDRIYRVRIEASGATFRVFIDGSFVTDFTDSNLTDGGIFGLSVITSDPPQAATFDNLKIYEVP